MEFRRPRFIARFAAPLRGTGQGLVLASLVIVGVGFMFLGSHGAGTVERMRTAVTDVAAPILEVLAEPVSAANRAIARVEELFHLRSENIRLREEVARLRAWRGAAHRLAAENAALRTMVGYKGPRRHAFVSARVIADGRGPFVRSMLVNAGSRNGVAKGQGVITPAGLVGRVVAVGERSARILILTDLNSRIPVVIEESRIRAILSGDNSRRPRLAFLPSWAKTRAGQRVVTSGHGGILPPGLPVGRIHSRDGNDVRIQPFVDLSRVEYVQVVDFQPLLPPASGDDGDSGSVAK